MQHLIHFKTPSKGVFCFTITSTTMTLSLAMIDPDRTYMRMATDQELDEDTWIDIRDIIQHPVVPEESWWHDLNAIEYNNWINGETATFAISIDNTVTELNTGAIIAAPLIFSCSQLDFFTLQEALLHARRQAQEHRKPQDITTPFGILTTIHPV